MRARPTQPKSQSLPATAQRPFHGQKCNECKEAADFIFGSVTKKRWCAPGCYTTKGTGWCWTCWNRYVAWNEKQRAADEAARIAELDAYIAEKAARAAAEVAA